MGLPWEVMSPPEYLRDVPDLSDAEMWPLLDILCHDEKDMKMMLANCGNLFLDPAVVTEVYHEFVVLEMIHGQPEFCPGASLEAITKRILKFS